MSGEPVWEIFRVQDFHFIFQKLFYSNWCRTSWSSWAG